MTHQKKQILAAVLILLWGGVAFWQWKSWEEPVHVPLTNVTGSATVGQSVATKGAGTRVKIELLASADAQRKATFTTPRNIFAVPTPEGTLPVPPGQGVENRPEPGVENRQPPVSEKTVQQQMTEAQVSPYRYLGFLRMGDNRQRDMAVLGKDDEVMVLKVGDRVEEHLVIKAITSESVTFHDTATRVTQTVPLSDDIPVEE